MIRQSLAKRDYVDATATFSTRRNQYVDPVSEIEISVGYGTNVVAAELNYDTVILDDQRWMVVTPNRQERHGEPSNNHLLVCVEFYAANEP